MSQSQDYVSLNLFNIINKKDSVGLKDYIRKCKDCINLNIVKDDYVTPLSQVIDNNDIDCFEVLIEAGADINFKRDKKGSLIFKATDSILKRFIELGADVNEVRTMDGDSPLIVAAYRGLYKKVKMLLDAGADINYKNGWGKTALDYAMEKEHIPVIHLLVQAEQLASTKYEIKVLKDQIVEISTRLDSMFGQISNLTNQIKELQAKIDQPW